MTKKDLNELQSVCALYSMCYALNELICQLKYSDIPDCMTVEAESLSDALTAMISQMETYREDVRELFFSACEDKEKDE